MDTKLNKQPLFFISYSKRHTGCRIYLWRGYLMSYLANN